MFPAFNEVELNAANELEETCGVESQTLLYSIQEYRTRVPSDRQSVEGMHDWLYAYCSGYEDGLYDMADGDKVKTELMLMVMEEVEEE